MLGFFHQLRLSTRWFLQRHTRGFDDTEIWDLDSALYRWLLPRLKCFASKDYMYPNTYSSQEEWQAELEHRIEQLELIVEDDITRSVECNFAREDFNKWMCKNINSLWY